MSSSASSGLNYNTLHQHHHFNGNNIVPISVRPKLLQYVEEHITSLIQDAISIQRHSKRARLNPQVVLNTNDGSGVQQHAGAAAAAGTTTAGCFKTRLHAADINLALQLKGCEKLYGNIMGSSLSLSSNTKKVMLSDVLKEEIPPPPEEVSMKQHWLVIDGHEPSKATTSLLSSSPDDTIPTMSGTTYTTTSIDLTNTYESSDVLLRIHQLQSGLLSEELKLYFLRVIHTLEQQNGTSSYYDRCEQDKVLLHLQTDHGLQELVPFFIRYTQHAIYEHIQSNHFENCTLIVRFIRSLLYNPTIHLELHLHEILPSLMTCVVAKSFGTRLSSSSSSVSMIHLMTNHYYLRNEAASTLAICTNLFSKDYTTLKSRILRTLCQALEMDDDHNLSSRYGGIIAITLFGNRAIDAFIMPLIMDCWDVWEEELGNISFKHRTAARSSTVQVASELLEMEIIMCQYAVLNSLSTYLQSTTVEERSERLLHLNINEVLGDDRMILLSSDYSDDYNMCFV
jgi:transcription initiation factor TFIID subunit 6